MKKMILSALAIFALASANAQFEIRYNGQGDDISGTTYEVTVYPEVTKYVSLWVLNTGNTDEAITITRTWKDVPTGWLNQELLCWPPDCYSVAGSGDSYQTPGDVVPTVSTTQNSAGLVSNATSGIFVNVKAELKPGVKASTSATGSATIMYYLTKSDGSYVDSVAVKYTIAADASIGETSKLDLTVAPNPASNNLTVDFDGANSADLKMVDVLGNVVLEKTITGKETIDVTSFRNGIYFVAISSEGRKPVVRKVIVRH